MANLLSNTTIGGYQSIHTGNIGSYALTSLPSHNHDDRYFTETESDGRFQPLENQRLSTGNSPTFADLYTNGWFRNYNNYGLYNQTHGNHFYATSNNQWTIAANGSYPQIVFRSGGYEGTIRGFVYADTENTIGFLNNAGSWSLRTNSSRDTQIFGTLTVGSSGSSDIYMTDTDETTRRIHTNSGRIGFLNSSSNWGAYCDNTGNWFSDHSMRAPIFYDSANTAYYVDPAGTSNIWRLYANDKYHYFGYSDNWDNGNLNGENSTITNVHFQGHPDFWIGAGNTKWYTSVASGHHDLLINTMQAGGGNIRGITFTASTSGGSVYRLGRWFSHNTQVGSYLQVDGGIKVGGTTDNYNAPVAKLQVISSTSGSDVLAVDGVNGRLFTVTDDLSDSLFSVNTIAGLPVIEAFADNTVKIGKYGSNSITISNSRIAINSDSVDSNFPFYVGDRSTAGSRYSLTNPGMGFNLADSYAQLQLFGTSGAYIDFTTSSGQDSAGRIMWSGHFLFSGDVYFNNPLYTYTLYDRNDTGYYLDMNGTSRLGTVNVNQLSVYGNTYLGDGNGDEVHINDILRVGATDSGDAHIFFGEGGSAGSDYGAHLYWDSGYTFTWYTRNAGSDTALFNYVTNDTTYINWSRNFNMQNREINYVSQLHFNGGTRFLNYSSNYLHFQTDSTSVGGIIVRDGNSSTRGYSGYFDGAGFGLLNSSGSWGIRLNPGNVGTELFYAGDWRVQTVSGGTKINGNLYTNTNYGFGLVGLYSASRYQGVFAMSDDYKLSDDGTSTGTLYGIAWTHTNVGGQSKSGLGHQALFMDNGNTQTAIGTGIWTNGLITTTSYGTSANWNTAYGWGNHASAGYQSASTAITTSNIGSQSVTNSAQLNGLSKIQLWNNSGQGHSTYQTFGAIPNFGVWFMQNSSAGDTPQSGSQYYVQTQGLGSEYGYGTTGGNYALMTAVARDHARKYTYYRTLENGGWGSWTKGAAGYADEAAVLSSMNISQFTNNSGYLTGITSGQVTGALGYTPYNSSNPSGYITSGDTTTGIFTTFLGNATSNISSGYTRVIRNENGAGGAPNYAPILHVAASDTMWQIAGAHAGQTTLVWRSGYSGAWNTPWWTIYHSGNFTDNSSNWNTAYSWGNHASAGYLTSLPSHNHDDRYYTESESDSRYFIKSGSWLGDLASYGYTREAGMQMTGGSEFVVLSKSGQGYTLVDGSYLAFEAGGFYSTSNSSGGTLLGFHSDTTSSVYFNTSTIKANGNVVWHAGNLTNLNQLSNGPGYVTSSGSVNYATTAGSAPNGSNINQFYNVSAGVGNGLSFWNGSSAYKISMGVGSLYQYGPVSDYSIKMQMNDGDTGRGFTWGRESYAPIAALNSTSGDMQIAGSLRAAGHLFTSYNGNNILLKTADAGGDAGILVQNSSGSFKLQIYGNGGDYGFLNGNWAGWDIRKTISGALYMNNDNGYYLQTNSTSNFYALNIQGSAVIHAGNIGSQSVSYASSAGSAGSVTGLTLTSSANGINPDSVTQNQIGYNTSVSLFGQTDGGLYSSAYSSAWIHQIYGDFRTGQIAIRGKNSGSWQAWRTVLDSSNYTSYAPSLTGSGASGTWSINVTGSAGSVAWTNVSSRPTALSQFTNDLGNYGGFLTSITAHTHAISDISGLQTALDGKQAAGSYAASSHTHDDRYYTESESDTRFARKDTDAAISGNLVIGNGTYGNSTAYGNSGARLMFSGSDGDAQGNYYIGTNHNDYGGNYSKLELRWHTGILMGAQPGYGGISIYDTEDLGTVIFSVGTGDSHVRVANNLYVGGNLALHAGNYNSYSPSLTGSGASGTWGINVTGSAGSVAWTNVSSRPTALSQFSNDLGNYGGFLTSLPAHDHDRVFLTDSRGASRAPSYYDQRYAQWDFQNTSDTGAGGDGWHGLLTVAKWAGYDSSHRQEQLAFTGDDLKRRTATSDSAWGSWKTIIDSGNIGSQSVSYANSAGSAPANGGNSTTVGGYAPSGSVGANTVVIRDSNNYIYAHYINSNVSESENPTINSFYTSNGDGWLRKSSLAHVKSQLGLGSMAYESSGTYQTAAGAINTGNIGSQSVSYATVSQQLNKFGDIYGQDWNTYYISGKMIVSSVYGGSGPNFPTGAYNYGGMLSYGVTGNEFFQVYFPENGAQQGGAFRKLHYRTGWNGSWSAWKSVVDQEGQVCTIAGSNQTGIEIHSNVGYNQDPLTYFLMRGQADNSWKAFKVRLTGDAGGQDIEFRRIAQNGADARMWYVPRGANTVNFEYAIVQPSDSRLKDNIISISTPIDKIKSIRGVEFDWNSGEHVGTHDVGLIAQDVEGVLPEAVTTQEDGYKNLAYTKVIPLLVEAMKEQQAMIDALKAEIELLKNK